MAVVRCLKGIHFYDDEKFSTCPHCEKQKETGQSFSEGADINSQITLAMEDAGANVIDVVGVMEQKPLKEHFHVDSVDEDAAPAPKSILNDETTVTQDGAAYKKVPLIITDVYDDEV